MIDKEIHKILFLPEYYTDEYNLTPMKNYWPFLKELVEIIKPYSVCEIGSERGLTSQLLGKVFKNIEKLHIVDPFISKELKKEKPMNMILYEETSLEFLQRGLDIELYLIDGDHNYYTVYNELLNIEKNRNKKQKTFILLHDVSWFCGRRDQYYNEELIPEKHESYNHNSLCLENDHNVKYGFSLSKNFSVAKITGGKKNGVLTAIEDFVEKSKLEWKFNYIPSLWGLGFLWLEDNFEQNDIEKIDKLLTKLDSLKEFFGILEANRLRLLQGLNEWQGLAEERLQDLQRLTKERDELYEIAENRLKDRNDLYNKAEERLQDLQRLTKERDELYEIAEERLALISQLKKNFITKWFIKD